MADCTDERPTKRPRREARSASSECDEIPQHPRSRESKPERSRRSHGDRDDRQNKQGRRRTSNDRRRSVSPDSAKDDESRTKRRRRSPDRGYERSRRHRSRSRSRSRSTSRHRHKHRHRNDTDRPRSSRQERDKPHRSRSSPSPKPYQRNKGALPSQNDAFTSTTTSTALTNPADKQKPNFATTGKLAALSNTVQTANQTIILKYHEPAESRKPPARDQWRLYIFKDDAILDTVELASQSCWLFGREVAVVDVPTEHPSCSKQHAVIQFRYIEKKNEFGDKVGKVKPYVLDLESAHGTMVNGETVPQAKYVELRDKDVVMFGESTREYVVQLPPPL